MIDGMSGRALDTPATAAGDVDAALEVACDESGSEGENLVGGNTDVFAHAGVAVTVPEATACVTELRERIGSPATEYKANHLLRTKHRSALEWFLGPWGPIVGRAGVHLVDKRYFLLRTLAETLVPEIEDAGLRLYREGPTAFGPVRWRDFLEAVNAVLRLRLMPTADHPVDTFVQLVSAAEAPMGSSLAEVLDRLSRSRPRALAYRAELLQRPRPAPVLDPLIPAVLATLAGWSGESRAQGRDVRLVHDQTNTLTLERVAYVEALANRRAGDGATPRLVALTLVDSQDDPRVQLADFLAGAARRIASDELNEHGDPGLTALLRPYVGAASVWADSRSWAALSGT